MTTTISTIKNGVPMYLAQGRGEYIDKGAHNGRNVFLTPKASPVTVHSAEGCTIVIGIKTAHGLDGQLVPSYGIAEAGQGLYTHKDGRHPFDHKNRRWKPTAVDGGWHLQYGPKEALYLGLSDDGAPTLTTTPTLWTIPDLKGPEEDKDAEILALKAKVATLEAKVAARDATIAPLEAKVAARDATIATLEARAQAAVKCIIGAA